MAIPAVAREIGSVLTVSPGAVRLCTQISKRELLDGHVAPSKQTVTVVLCDDIADVNLLYLSNLVGAKVIQRGGSSGDVNPDEVHILNLLHLGAFHSPSCQQPL